MVAQMTADEIAHAIGGAVSGRRDARFSGVSIDSRTVGPGELFVAIRGARLDGHEYIGEAFAKGAAGAVADHDWSAPAETPADRPVLRVADTHRALKDLAAETRRRWRGSVVGVTGSFGKTTTKEFAAHVLASEYSVHRSPGNLNNLFGLPLSLLGLRQGEHIGVFEMGMSARGEIAEMGRIARPDAGILTGVAPVHLEFFESVDEIARAKAELAEALDARGTLVYNADDPRVRAIAERAVCRTIGYGVASEDADVRAGEIEISGIDATRFRLTAFGESRRAEIPLAGLHYVANALAAVALARHYRIELDRIVESLAELEHAPMRGAVARFKRGFTLVDDSYNSNPVALVRMMENLAASPAERRIVVAGAMRELGAASPALHYDCGAAAARLGLDAVVAVEGDAREIARGAREGGVPESAVRFFETPAEAAEHLARTLRAGDLVLVKGSRGVRLERVIAALRAQEEGA